MIKIKLPPRRDMAPFFAYHGSHMRLHIKGGDSAPMYLILMYIILLYRYPGLQISYRLSAVPNANINHLKRIFKQKVTTSLTVSKYNNTSYYKYYGVH